MPCFTWRDKSAGERILLPPAMNAPILPEQLQLTLELQVILRRAAYRKRLSAQAFCAQLTGRQAAKLV